jgi:hypothetical protein
MSLVSGSSGGAAVVGGSSLIYRFTVTGADKASIDTGVDTAQAGSNDWTNGDLLEVFMLMRMDDAAATAVYNVTLNNDTGANYDRVSEGVVNATVSGGNSLAQNQWSQNCHGSGGSASYASAHKIEIPDYAGTTLFKTGTMTGGHPDGTAANNRAFIDGVGYRSTSAITRVKVANSNGAQKLVIGSQLLVYKRTAA